ncbi:MAG: chorismate-binding protein [Verrucomicrobia bacterium]|nr:chorismate-binding protein [Verrucomicrobiota bacterium]
MNITPDFSQFQQLSTQGNLIPLCLDLMADFETPVSVYTKLKASGPAFLLESIEGGANVNRYSFIGCQPRKLLEAHLGGQTFITERDGTTKTIPTPKDPLTLIQQEMEQFTPVALPNMPRFVGGAVGFLGYEYISCVEPSVPKAANDVLKMPVAHFMVTDTLVIFDRARQTLRLLVNVFIGPGEDQRAAYERGVTTLRQLADTLGKGREIPTVPVPEVDNIPVPQGNFDQAEFEAMVERCKEYVRAGDVIQVVGSQRFSIPFEHSSTALYRALRVVNPSPYMFLYDPGPFALVGASPEVHVRLTDGLAEVRPIAGTRPRGKTIEQDLAYEKDLLADEKEKAEHLMLVDLARNDLGRVCKYGSVRVPEYMIVERYSHVMHIVSQVEGTIDDRYNAYDLMRATFPAALFPGAPKIRAMQIIAEQEKEQRGPYAGALCYFSYDGNLDSCIAIRTALLREGTLHVQAGAGLVADSVPASEFMETVNKAKGMLKAVAMAGAMHC